MELDQSNYNLYLFLNIEFIANRIALNRKPLLMLYNVNDYYSYSYFENFNITKYTSNPEISAGKLVTDTPQLGGHTALIIGYIDVANQPS